MSTARSHLRFEQRDGQTRLAVMRTELPLVVQRPLRGPRGEAVVVLLTPAGALFDGDALSLEIVCGPGTDVTVGTASATKLNRCERGEIELSLWVEVAAGACFRYLPHELIPFRGARYRQGVAVDLQDDARASVLEIVGAGRVNEAFSYTWLDFETIISHAGQVVARERSVMSPSTADQLQGRTHYASLFACGPGLDQAAAARMNQGLACSGSAAGASALPAHGVVLKMVGEASQPLRAALLSALATPAWVSALLPP